MLAFDNIEIQYNKEVKAIYGDDLGVTSIDLYDNKLNTLENRQMDGVFLAIGHTPNSEIFKKEKNKNNPSIETGSSDRKARDWWNPTYFKLFLFR